MRRRHGTRRALCVALVLAAAACGEANDVAGAGDGPTVVCTTAMVGDVVSAVAGDAAEVIVLFGPNVDPHLFRPTRDDVAVLMRADAVIYNGLHLEGYVVEALERVAETGTPVIALAEEILDEDEMLRSGGTVDPHVWMDPSLWLRTADVVADVLGELAPESAEDLSARASSFAAQIEALDADFADRLGTIDEERRILLTAHDAFGYFGHRYRITVEGIQGVSTASEAGLRAIEELVDLVVERRVPAVFFESTVSERNVRALVEGASARGHEVAIGGVLHADAPGDAGTYIGMLEHNVATIVDALATSPANTSAAGEPTR